MMINSFFFLKTLQFTTIVVVLKYTWTSCDSLLTSGSVNWTLTGLRLKEETQPYFFKILW